MIAASFAASFIGNGIGVAAFTVLDDATDDADAADVTAGFTSFADNADAAGKAADTTVAPNDDAGGVTAGGGVANTDAAGDGFAPFLDTRRVTSFLEFLFLQVITLAVLFVVAFVADSDISLYYLPLKETRAVFLFATFCLSGKIL